MKVVGERDGEEVEDGAVVVSKQPGGIVAEAAFGLALSRLKPPAGHGRRKTVVGGRSRIGISRVK